MSFPSWLRNLRSAPNSSRRALRDETGVHHAERDGYMHRRRGLKRAAKYRPNLEVLEDRCMPALYAVTDLGSLGYGAYAYDLNEAGQVVGYAPTTEADGLGHAFLWQNGTMIDLGTLGGSSSYAAGINDLGQVVGWTDLPGDASRHAFLVTPQGGVWFQDSNLDGRNDLMIDLGTLNGSDYSQATDINSAGQVVGSSGGRAFLWDAVNGMTDLGVPLGLAGSSASGINESGQVTGTVTMWNGDPESGYQYSTFLWDAANGMTILGTAPAYTDSVAQALNDAGQLVGYQLWGGSAPGGTRDAAFLWTPDAPNGLTGSFTDLGMLPGASDSNAIAINNAGQVVGSSGANALLWDGAGGMTDLHIELPAGYDFSMATAINDSGAIAVNGFYIAGQDHAYLLTPVSPGTPTISIADAPAVTEGNAGTRAATFTVTLSAASNQTVTVAYATANGTATAGSDYLSTSGTLTFTPGETSKTVTVLVYGDRFPEPNETYFVNLSGATNAVIADSQGVGTILDDEPRISISDVTKYEGKKGQTTLFAFTVTLSAAYDQPVTMSFRSVDGTATTSDKDYVAQTGTIIFAPGETTKTITIVVNGDNKKEANETFYLDLFGNSLNSLFTKSRGMGTILNDD